MTRIRTAATLTALVAGIALLLGACRSDREGSRIGVGEVLTARTRGLAYLGENSLEEAETEFRKLIRLAPDEAAGYANLGLVYLRLGRLAEAEQQIQEASRRQPDDPDIGLMLATLYRLTGRERDAQQSLGRSLERSPTHLKTLYALAELAAESGDPGARSTRVDYLRRLQELAAANVAVRLQLAEAVLQQGESEEALELLEQLRQQLPELPTQAAQVFSRSVLLLQASRGPEALAQLASVRQAMEVTAPYQAGLADLRGPSGAPPGYPVLGLNPNLRLGPQDASTVVAAIRFIDITAGAGLDLATPVRPSAAPRPRTQAALGDYDGDGDPDVFVSAWWPDRQAGEVRLLRNDVGSFADVTRASGIEVKGPVVASTFADYDNDGHMDLYVVSDDGPALFHNRGEGRFRDVARVARVSGTRAALKPLFLDLDHDGDLDLYLTRIGTNAAYRNNLDGTFREQAGEMGIGGPEARSRDVAFGDFDGDARIDLLVVNEDASNVLYHNTGQGRFEDLTVASGLASQGGSGTVAVGDYDSDGFLDLFVAALSGGRHRLYHNRGDGTFEPDGRADGLIQALGPLSVLDAEFLDFDNDGWLDLAVAGQAPSGVGRGAFLFHNTGSGGFVDRSGLLPGDVAAAHQLLSFDYGADGDLDLLMVGVDGQLRLLRNDGGNANQYLTIQLVGLRAGSGKNNQFGIGAKLEVRSGELYQMRVVTDPVTHIGLGQHFKADVVRVQWPNGVPQAYYYPGSDRDFLEAQTLKGSCAFVYTWNGRGYTFLSDFMWRSALGMPLGIMGGDAAYAPPQASQEYVRIPGEALQPERGRYRLQVTEELWEVAYLDQVQLLAVDHPDSIDIYVDERFVPPGHKSLDMYRVGATRMPVSASDDLGRDLLPLLREKDNRYVGGFTPDRYQGITQLHDLILDLGDVEGRDGALLFLQGWIFPTDASINVAMSQSSALQAIPPYVQVRDAGGRWRTVIENMSFPAGKDKTVAVDLRGKFTTDDRHVRIRTNMEIYWDHVFFAAEESAGPVRVATLDPSGADHHYRGFSRLLRKGGRYGPHWFDYTEVSRDPRWHPIQGRFTRYGDVRALLLESDDQYVVMGPGDEMTVEFVTADAPELPAGWTREFLLYSDGWIKDADLNTATGSTVEPLPFHAMSRYPYAPVERYPTDASHQRYLRTYNTREVRLDQRARLTSSGQDGALGRN